MLANNQEQKPIMVTTAMFDLLKVQVVKKKLKPVNETQIIAELKSSVQLLRKDLPGDVVDVYKLVKVLNRTSGTVETYKFFPPHLAKNKNGTTSILTDIGLALLGHSQGAILQWETPKGVEVYEIESVNEIV